MLCLRIFEGLILRVTTAKVVERAVGSGEASAASYLWVATAVAEDDGGLSVDDQSSAGRRRIQQRWFRRQRCPRGGDVLGV